MDRQSKIYARRMTVLRMRLQTERNCLKPDQAKIDQMMAEYKRLETAAHVRLVFGDRGHVEEMTDAEAEQFTQQKLDVAQEFIDDMAGE